ncbi:fungal-specific transcription factor domain-domain-containing protein [Naematelia encephala]|uniref:Fungal-specific transcription factor domain-domain-containing protein n=1 Tax=Naematelia encephala TaxID=71784 RepID=A0A1Y2BK00_9TREE|nr:fungal-specific transcription factor domain-domain-containing protein [Naematelia encephala]
MSSRKTRHASKACLACRKRKTRCSGERPACGLCRTHNWICELVDDKRQAPMYRRVKQLEDHIARLEHELKRFRSAFSEDTNGSPISERDYSENEDPDPMGVERLKIIDSNTGEISHFGPPSCLMHLPETAFSPSTNSTSSSHPSQYPILRMPPSTSRGVKLSQATGEIARAGWRMYLPRECVGMDLHTHDVLLDSYEGALRESLVFGGLVDIDRFRSDLIKCTSQASFSQNSDCNRTDDYSPLLHNALLALGSLHTRSKHLHDRSYVDMPDETVANTLISQACGMLEWEAERPLLSTVRGLILVTIVMGQTGRLNSAFSYFGMAIRMADSLGLTVDCSHLVSSGKLTAKKQQDQNTILWILFIQDKLQCLTVGRSPGMPITSINVPLPKYLPLDPADSSSYALERNTRFRQNVRSAMCRLSSLVGEILQQCYSPSFNRSSKKAEVMKVEMNDKLDTFIPSLPPSLQLPMPLQAINVPGAVIALHIAHWFNVILLNRPFYRPNSIGSGTSADTQLSDHAADMIVDLLDLYEQLYGLEHSLLTTTHAVFHAGSIFLMKAAAAGVSTDNTPTDTLAKLNRCIRALELMRIPTLASWNASTLQALKSQWLVVSPAEQEPIPDVWEDFGLFCDFSMYQDSNPV